MFLGESTIPTFLFSFYHNASIFDTHKKRCWMSPVFENLQNSIFSSVWNFVRLFSKSVLFTYYRTLIHGLLNSFLNYVQHGISCLQCWKFKKNSYCGFFIFTHVSLSYLFSSKQQPILLLYQTLQINTAKTCNKYISRALRLANSVWSRDFYIEFGLVR